MKKKTRCCWRCRLGHPRPRFEIKRNKLVDNLVVFVSCVQIDFFASDRREHDERVKASGPRFVPSISAPCLPPPRRMPQTPLRPPSDVTQILNDLEDNGYSAIHLLPEPDVAVLRTLFYRWLADLGTGITSDPATWTDSRMPKQAKGIYHSYGCGHAACSWALRCHPDVRGLFAAVHKCSPDQLLTGFDGLGFMRPPELLAEMGVKQEPGTSWPHLDFMPVQNGVVRERFPVVQGNVALYNSGPEDGGLVVYSGSHKLFNTSWEGREVKQFSALFQDGKELPKGVERIKLCGPPGTFFM